MKRILRCLQKNVPSQLPRVRDAAFSCCELLYLINVSKMIVRVMRSRDINPSESIHHVFQLLYLV